MPAHQRRHQLQDQGVSHATRQIKGIPVRSFLCQSLPIQIRATILSVSAVFAACREMAAEANVFVST